MCLLPAACSAEERPREARPSYPSPDEVRAELAPLPFDDFIERSFRLWLARSPEWVIDLGLQEELAIGESFLDDHSAGFQAETRALEVVILERTRAFDAATLTATQARTRDIYEWYFDDRVRGHRFTDLEYRITPGVNSVPLNTQLFFTDIHPLRNAADAEQYAARLWDVAAKIEHTRSALLSAADRGIHTPRPILEWSRPGIAAVAFSTPTGTAYYRALADRLPPDADREVLDRAEAAITEAIQPAYRALDATVEALSARAPEELGVWQLPGGGEYYAWTLRHHITTTTTAAALEQLGLAELEDIHGELRARFAELGYPAGESIAESLARAAGDGGRVPTANVVAEYEEIIRDAEARSLEVFDRLPTAKVVVKGGSFGGVYVGASLDGARPGAFFAFVPSAGELRFGMRTLAYHETIPGHHLQIGLAQELELPLFQRVLTFTGYVEGWALYAEQLAYELGWYEDDTFGDIGRLQARAFRAARLVADTGLHDRHWSFDQAVSFMQEKVGFSQGAAAEQVARYASWPGQATAYYTGMSQIRALAASSPHLDRRAFHRAVLGHGSVPLEVLETIVEEAR